MNITPYTSEPVFFFNLVVFSKLSVSLHNFCLEKDLFKRRINKWWIFLNERFLNLFGKYALGKQF